MNQSIPRGVQGSGSYVRRPARINSSLTNEIQNDRWRPEALDFLLRVLQMRFGQVHVPLRRVQVRMSHQLSHTEHVDARFNGPCSIAFNRAKVAAPLSIRRRYLVSVALLAASVSTVLNMAWNASWLKHAGSPHGMGAGPGLWQSLGPSLIWSFVAATVLSFFGKGKFRVLMIGWSVSLWAVFQSIFVLQFD